jgi:hypothetical protein
LKLGKQDVRYIYQRRIVPTNSAELGFGGR